MRLCTNVSSMKEVVIIEKSLTPPVEATPNPETNIQVPEDIENTHTLDTGDSLEEELDWPQLAEANAMLVVPSFAKRDALESHGGSAFQKRRTKELVREK